jgi:hypothetical protein
MNFFSLLNKLPYMFFQQPTATFMFVNTTKRLCAYAATETRNKIIYNNSSLRVYNI